MSEIKIIISIFFIILISSCKENYIERPFDYVTIRSISEKYPDNSKPFITIRLAFAKTLAKAFEHYEFREYIWNTSKHNTESVFNEILFSLHHRDIIYNKKTLFDYINEAADNEVISLFGNNFAAVILENDPMATIKIPDIFYNFNWEYEKFAPIVYAKTIDPIIEKNNYYIGYHFTGYQEKLNRSKKVKKFSIVVKYSEDYLLLNKINWKSYQGLSFFDLFPQYTPKSLEKIKPKILQKSISSITDQNMIYVKKIDIFNLYRNHIELQDIPFINIDNCNKNCFRDCKDQDSSYTTIGSIRFITEDLIYAFEEKTYILQDNIEFLMLYNAFISGTEVKVFDKYIIAGLRRDNFINRKININLILIPEKYKDIGLVMMPHIEVNIEILDFKTIELNHLLEKGWNSSKNIDRDIEFFMIFREELFNYYRIGIGKKNDITNEFLSRYRIVGNEYLLYCDPPYDYLPFGSTISIKYKY